jgi:hypothetical protein
MVVDAIQSHLLHLATLVLDNKEEVGEDVERRRRSSEAKGLA